MYRIKLTPYTESKYIKKKSKWLQDFLLILLGLSAWLVMMVCLGLTWSSN